MKIIAVGSVSASGKTTLVNKVIELFNLHKCKTTTTRKIRPGESVDDYYFVTVDEFNDLLNNDKLIEHNVVYGNSYGLSKAELTIGETIPVVVILDVGGIKTIKSKYPDTLTIFIEPPSREIIIERLKDRKTGDVHDMERRLNEFDREVIEGKSFDQVITQGNIDDMLFQFNSIITQYLK